MVIIRPIAFYPRLQIQALRMQVGSSMCVDQSLVSKGKLYHLCTSMACSSSKHLKDYNISCSFHNPTLDDIVSPLQTSGPAPKNAVATAINSDLRSNQRSEETSPSKSQVFACRVSTYRVREHLHHLTLDIQSGEAFVMLLFTSYRTS